MSSRSFLLKLTLVVLLIAFSIGPLQNLVNRPPYPILRLLHSIFTIKHSFQIDEIRPTLTPEYRAFESLLRVRPIRKPDPNNDPMVDIREVRSRFIFDSLIPKPSTCQIDQELFEHNGHSVLAYWIDQHSKKSDHLLIYLHGGGYIMGDINIYGGIECHLSKLFDVAVLHVEYRLSPEHALSAAVEDTIAIYHALLNRNFSASQLLLMGDSAGGGLALLVTQSLINYQMPLPRGLVLLSPWTDISSSGESHIRNRHTELVLTMYERDWIIQRLLGQIPPDDPRYSPLFGSFIGFPPMYINVGTAEILEDDSRRVYAKALEAGVDVTFEQGEHLMHIYPVFFDYFPEARRTLANIHQWIDKLFHRN